MPPIVNEQVAWSVGLKPSEPCRKLGSDQEDSGGPRENPLHIVDRFGRILYCVRSIQYSLLFLLYLNLSGIPHNLV